MARNFSPFGIEFIEYIKEEYIITKYESFSSASVKAFVCWATCKTETEMLEMCDGITKDTFNRRMTLVYEAFGIKGNGRGKEQKLYHKLKQEEPNYKNLRRQQIAEKQSLNNDNFPLNQNQFIDDFLDLKTRLSNVLALPNIQRHLSQEQYQDFKQLCSDLNQINLDSSHLDSAMLVKCNLLLFDILLKILDIIRNNIID